MWGHQDWMQDCQEVFRITRVDAGSLKWDVGSLGGIQDHQDGCRITRMYLAAQGECGITRMGSGIIRWDVESLGQVVGSLEWNEGSLGWNVGSLVCIWHNWEDVGSLIWMQDHQSGCGITSRGIVSTRMGLGDHQWKVQDHQQDGMQDHLDLCLFPLVLSLQHSSLLLLRPLCFKEKSEPT